MPTRAFLSASHLRCSPVPADGCTGFSLMSGRTKHPRRRSALRDLLWISLAFAGLFWLGAGTNAFEALNRWVRERFPGQQDEILAGFVLAAVGLGLFAILQWRGSRLEAAARVAAEGRFQALIEEMPAVTYTWDPRKSAGLLPPPYVSPQVEPILGFSVEEWKADPGLWIRQIHPEDRERVLEASERADRTGEPFAIEYRHIKKDGSVIWVREEAIVVEHDGEDRPSLVQGLMYDVTERKRAEQHLEEAEARYRTLVERVPAVTYTWDSAFRSGEAPAPYISPQVFALLGYTPDEFGDPQLWSQARAPRRLRPRHGRVGSVSGRRRGVPFRVPDAREGRAARLGTRRGRPDLPGRPGQPDVPGGHVRHHRSEGGRDQTARGRGAFPEPRRADPGDHVRRGSRLGSRPLHQPADREGPRLHPRAMDTRSGTLGAEPASRGPGPGPRRERQPTRAIAPASRTERSPATGAWSGCRTIRC